MNDQEKRIKLAEAMGWVVRDNGWAVAPDKKLWPLSSIPDPFTDANDDYAVLEWMIGQGLDSEIFKEACLVMLSYPAYRYKIGDNARAALKLIS